MNLELNFAVKGAPSLPNAFKSGHWSKQAKERKMWREAVVWAVRSEMGPEWPPQPFERATVLFDCYRSGQPPDHDNLVASIKPLLDGLQPQSVTRRKSGQLVVSVGCGVIANDTMSCIGEPMVRWFNVPRGKEHVIITVTETEQEGAGEDDEHRDVDGPVSSQT